MNDIHRYRKLSPRKSLHYLQITVVGFKIVSAFDNVSISESICTDESHRHSHFFLDKRTRVNTLFLPGLNLADSKSRGHHYGDAVTLHLLKQMRKLTRYVKLPQLLS